MNSLNGGYAMIKYNSTQEELQIAYRSKRPVLFYDENRRAHWAVIEETSTESVDEETQEPITIYEYRLIDEATLDDIVDSHNHKRFIEGDLTTRTIAGVEFTYAKWSLSGTHLMIVLAGNIANGTKLSNNTIIATSSLEAWILSKIYPVFANDAIEVKSLSLYGNDWSSQSLPIGFKKFNDRIELVIADRLTLSANRGFRIQFDLLIDAS